MPKNNGNTTSKELDFLQAYPVLTEATTADGGKTSGTAAGSTSSIGQLVGGTLREVLAWRPKTTDPKGFVAALNQAFSITEVDGHTEWKWTPRSYAIQADMGAVTGAQASIYARAKNALDQALPLLEGLYPLRPDADVQDTEAIQALVQAAMTELVGELGQVGGPRLQRVDAHIEALLGSAASDTRQEDAERVGGLLGLLRDRYGMEQRLVNTIAEEQNLTNYRILVDHMVALRHTWNAQRHFFDRKGTDVFLGTQLVLLSRALAVMGDAVESTADALDSVYIRAGDRQVTQLSLRHHNQHEFPLTIDEFLRWIASVATDEGPRAINEGGKDGVITLQPILNQLHQLARDFLEVVEHDSKQHRDLPPGLFTPRVRVAVEGLESSVGEASTLANKLRRAPSPRIYDADPNPIMVASDHVSGSLFIQGELFQQGLQVRLKRITPDPNQGSRWIEENTSQPTQISTDKVHVISAQSARASLSLTPDHAGDWRLVATNPDGGQSTFEPITIKIPDVSVRMPPPLTYTVAPNEGYQGQSLVLTLTATSGAFEPNSTFSLGPDIGIGGDLIGDEKQISATIMIAPHATPTTRDIRVSSDAPATRLPGAFTVLPARSTTSTSSTGSASSTAPPVSSPGTSTTTTPTAVSLNVTEIQFINASSKARSTKKTVQAADFRQSHTFSASKDGIDTINVIFDQDLDHAGQPTGVVQLTNASGPVNVRGMIQGRSVILEQLDAAGKLENFPTGTCTIRVPQDTSSLLANSTLPGDLTVQFEITA